MDTLKAIQTLARIRRENKLKYFQPYPWQKEIFEASSVYGERFLIAGNRVGKSEAAAYEVAIHATGDYPDWWTGYRYKKPPLIWCSGVTNESLRDITQKKLLGGVGEDVYGTGFIPKDRLSKPAMRQCGIAGVVESVKVKHKSGGYSDIVWKSYEQGWQKFQGAEVDLAWLDEDPDDEQLFTEVLTRLITVKGLLLVTFTPLLGMTPLLRHIYDLGAKVYRKNVTWDETPHLSARDREEILSKYPEHERETRSKGIPMRGQGVVFPIPEARIKCAPFAIPSHWPQIIGIDFGWDHPNATVKCAYDADNDVFYVTKASKRSKRTPLEHSAEIKAMGGGGITGWVPVSWPHDGINTEKSGETVKKQYEDHDINLIQFTARYDDEKGGGQSVEAIVMDVYERATTDRFKVFDTETLFFEEYRNYYRKDGKIVPIDDDILKAAFYALMMKRYAMPEYVARLSQTQPPEGAYI